MYFLHNTHRIILVNMLDKKRIVYKKRLIFVVLNTQKEAQKSLCLVNKPNLSVIV